jgi:predicted aspartyl protease
VHGPEEVSIEKRGDTYRVRVRINDTITLPFLLDTGVSDLAIPADVALTLVRAGALASGDFIGKDRYTLANGSEEVREQAVIREVQVGDYAVRNVTATISPPQGEPLLGQSFLSKFGAVTLDYKRLVLILSR